MNNSSVQLYYLFPPTAILSSFAMLVVPATSYDNYLISVFMYYRPDLFANFASELSRCSERQPASWLFFLPSREYALLTTGKHVFRQQASTLSPVLVEASTTCIVSRPDGSVGERPPVAVSRLREGGLPAHVRIQRAHQLGLLRAR